MSETASCPWQYARLQESWLCALDERERLSSTNHHGQPPPKPCPKQSVIKPNTEVSSHLREILSEVRSYVWKYEARWDAKKQKWIWGEPARSPKTKRHRKIRWGKENFERDKHLWGNFEEALLAYERNRGDLQGVGVLIEPDRTLKIDGEDRVPVWTDFDDCRSISTGEVEPRVMEEIRKLDTYTELSPSGKGLRCLGRGRRHLGSYTFFKIDDHRVEVYGGGQTCS